MDHDDRDRRDWPDDERAGDPPEQPDPSMSPDDSTRPMPIDETTPAGAASSDAWGGDAAGPVDSGDDPGGADGWRNPEQPERVIEEHDRPLAAPDGDAGAPAEIESWPSSEPVEPAAGASAPWPTEPPPAGSASSDAWPTSAPERGETPPPEPDWGSATEPSATEPSATEAETAEPESTEPPAVTPSPGWSDERAPEEVEAYPAAAETTETAPATAAPMAAATAAHAVPDAEGATGESTLCPRCGTENRPGLSFCRSCGQRLVAAGVSSTVERPGTPEGTQACPRCGTHNRAGVAFCQNCGANLRGTAEGYVPPAAADEEQVAPRPQRGAILGPVVLLVGLAGLVTGYLLPFLYGSRDSLFDRAWGADGYGVAFWNGYPDVGASLADQAYFGLAGPIPLFGLLLVVLAVAGFMRATPGPAQSIGLVLALLWSIGLIVLFVMVELLANWSGDLVGMLRDLTPAGIIFFLASLIVLIGTLTRFSRG